LGSFHVYLRYQRIKESQRQKELTKKYGKTHGNDINDTKWIEILIETPISDYRKNAMSLIIESK
jgi:cytidylate kinase